MGERVANQLLSPNMLNYIELSKEHNLEEIKIPSKMAEKSLRELDIRAKYNVSVIAIVREGEIIISPSPDDFSKRRSISNNRREKRSSQIFQFRLMKRGIVTLTVLF